MPQGVGDDGMLLPHCRIEVIRCGNILQDVGGVVAVLAYGLGVSH